MVHQIINRINILEDAMKEAWKFSHEANYSGCRRSLAASPAKNPVGVKSDQFMSDIMARSQQIAEIRTELHQIHDTVLNYLQVPRSDISAIVSPSSHRLNIDRGWKKQGQSSSSIVSQPIKEEDFMRNFLDKKARGGGREVPATAVKQKRKRRRKPKNDRGYRSEEFSLSGSWEDVSQTEVESIF